MERWAVTMSLDGNALPAKTKALDCRSIAFNIILAQICQQPSPASNKLEQPTPRVVVVLMLAQVLDQQVDAFGQNCNLNLR